MRTIKGPAIFVAQFAGDAPSVVVLGLPLSRASYRLPWSEPPED
jgi:hypothetical protein